MEVSSRNGEHGRSHANAVAVHAAQLEWSCGPPTQANAVADPAAPLTEPDEPCNAATSKRSDGVCLVSCVHGDTPVVPSKSGRLRRVRRERRRKQALETICQLQLVDSGIRTRNTRPQLNTPFAVHPSLRFAQMGLGVSWCKVYGYGVKVFDKSIQKGDVVTQYYGALISKSEREQLAIKTHIFSWGKGQGCDIDGIKIPESGFPAGSFINHSTTPNCKLIREPLARHPHLKLGGVFAVAIADIPKFSWLSVDYGRSFLKSEITNLG